MSKVDKILDEVLKEDFVSSTSLPEGIKKAVELLMGHYRIISVFDSGDSWDIDVSGLDCSFEDIAKAYNLAKREKTSIGDRVIGLTFGSDSKGSVEIIFSSY